MRCLVFLLEEPSAQDALEGFLANIIPGDIEVVYLIFEGKQDLQKRMGRTLRAWKRPDSCFIVLRDQDCGDCKAIKADLLVRCREAGCENESLVRIACRELESWFLGDWEAVAKAFSQERLARLKNKAIYQDPDRLSNPAKELEKHLPYYQKRDGARRVGRFLNQENNTSRSFQIFLQAVRRFLAESS